METWLSELEADVRYTRFYESWELPDLGSDDLVIAMGGSMSANDEREYPWLKPEKMFIHEAICRGLPVVGVCLGAQIIASALGTRVFANAEVGNILAVSGQNLAVIFGVGLVILLLVRAFYKELLIVSFDPTLGATLQYPVEGLRYLLLLMLAMTAVIAIQAVGVVLIAAMMVTPAASCSSLLDAPLRIMRRSSALSDMTSYRPARPL